MVIAGIDGDARADHQFRRTVTIEAALGVVLTVTAVLVASSAV